MSQHTSTGELLEESHRLMTITSSTFNIFSNISPPHHHLNTCYRLINYSQFTESSVSMSRLEFYKYSTDSFKMHINMNTNIIPIQFYWLHVFGCSLWKVRPWHTLHDICSSSALVMNALCFALSSAGTIDHVTWCLWCHNTLERSCLWHNNALHFECQNTAHPSSVQTKDKSTM